MEEASLSPFKDAAKLDLLIERKDGRVEMCIVAQRPLDSSRETLSLLEEKVRNYVREALDKSFRENYGDIEVQKIEIALVSKFDIDPAVTSLVNQLALEVQQAGLSLTVKRY